MNKKQKQFLKEIEEEVRSMMPSNRLAESTLIILKEALENNNLLGSMLLSAAMGNEFEWNKWMNGIPKIPMKDGWSIKVIPPFLQAIVRFKVYKGSKEVSVYLDCYSALGYFDGNPYWEIYPGVNGEPDRFAMNDINGLVAAIEKVLG